MEKSKKTKKGKEKLYTREDILHILTCYACTYDTHFNSRDYDANREWIEEHQLDHMLNQVKK